MKIETVTIAEPHPISPYGDEDFGYQSIKSSIMQVWDYTGVTVVPGTGIFYVVLVLYDLLAALYPSKHEAFLSGLNIAPASQSGQI